MFFPYELRTGEALSAWERIQSVDEGDGDAHATGEVEGVEPVATLPAIHWQTLEPTNKAENMNG